MIRFDRGSYRFNYRIVGVAIHEGQVLLFRAEHDPFWSLPGGRAELGESAEDTLRREMREELDVDVEVLRPLWFVENFFEYEGMSHHEIAVYFLMGIPDGVSPGLTSLRQGYGGPPKLQRRRKPRPTYDGGGPTYEGDGPTYGPGGPLASRTFESVDAGVRLFFEWHPLQQDILAALPLMPSFLPAGLLNLPASIAHIVHRDALVADWYIGRGFTPRRCSG